MNHQRRTNVSIISIIPLCAAVCFALLQSGCGSSYPAPGVDGKKYEYVYQLTEPVISPKMEFKDHRLSIAFSIDDAAITYTLLNLQPDLLRIESGDAMIGIDDQFFPVRNQINYYADSVSGLPPLTIPSRGYVNDIIIPRMNVFWNDDYGEWNEIDLFPTLDSGSVSVRNSIAQNIGKKLRIILPVSVGEFSKDYQFTFTVAAIKIVSPDAPVPVKVRPPAPKDCYEW